MSQYLETLYHAVRTVVAAAWPDVVANGIYEADMIEAIPYERLTIPYAVISIEEMSQTHDWAANALAYQPPVQIYYICAIEGPLSPIRAKLEDLRDALWRSPLDFGQVINIPSLSWSRELEMNRIMVDKGMAHRAGRLIAEILVGEGSP